MTGASRASEQGRALKDACQWALAHRRFGPMALFLTGALLSQAQPPASLFFLSFIAFPVFMAGLDLAKSGRSAFWRGWFAGFGYFLIGLMWVGASFSAQTHYPVFLAPFAVVGLAALCALYVALVFWAAHKLALKGWLKPLVFAALWILAEYARSVLLSGFPWALISTQWADWLAVAQAVHLTSVYALGFVTVAASLVGYGLFLAPAAERRSASLASGSAVAMLLIAALWGAQRLDAIPTTFHIGTDLRLIQANVPQKDKWKNELIEQHFNNHLQLSRDGDPKGLARGVDLLIWPEVSVQYLDFDRDNALSRYRISRLLEPGAFALVGARRVSFGADGEPQLFNSMFAVNRRGELYDRYDKQHLVPFSEYLPFAPVLKALGIEQLTGGTGFTPGDERTIIELPGIPAFRTLICYEAIFPGIIQPLDSSSPQPRWILNITNDAWFGDSAGPWQHLAQARMRAIEEGLPVVRAVSTGVSAVIDPLGRTTESLGVNQRGSVESPLPKPLSREYNINTTIGTTGRIYFTLVLLALLSLFAILKRILIK